MLHVEQARLSPLTCYIIHDYTHIYQCTNMYMVNLVTLVKWVLFDDSAMFLFKLIWTHRYAH